MAGDDWSRWARTWRDRWARLADPARRRLLEVTAVGPGTRLLDVGCGTGELAGLATGLGAEVAGVDRARGMLDLARDDLPDADLRVGELGALPWPDAAFDVAVAVNSLQFADDRDAAALDVRRVVRPGGLLAVCTWGRTEDQDLFRVTEALESLAPAPEPRTRPRLGDPGELEALLARTGLPLVTAGTVETPYVLDGRADLLAAHRLDIEQLGLDTGSEAVRAAIRDAAAPYRRDDGSYRFDNRFVYVVALA